MDKNTSSHKTADEGNGTQERPSPAQFDLYNPASHSAVRSPTAEHLIQSAMPPDAPPLYEKHGELETAESESLEHDIAIMAEREEQRKRLKAAAVTAAPTVDERVKAIREKDSTEQEILALVESIIKAKTNLTRREKLFLYYWMIDQNKAIAADKAGYPWPARSGWEIYQRPRVQDAIQEWIRQMATTAEDVVAMLTQVATGSIDMVLAEMPDEAGVYRVDIEKARRLGAMPLIESYEIVDEKKRGGVVKTTTTVKLISRMQALNQLAKIHGLHQRTKVKLTGDIEAMLERLPADLLEDMRNGRKDLLTAVVEAWSREANKVTVLEHQPEQEHHEIPEDW